MSIPLVSVITPTYNHAAVIGECIKSVLAQTMPDWEMIIVDDGSTDTTAEVVRSFDDPRIKLIQQPNKGPNKLGETYNAALAQATGQLVAILEGDDLWPADKLAQQTPDFEDPAVVLSWGKARVVSFEGEELAVIPPVLPPVEAQFNKPVGRATYTMLQPDWMTFAFPVTVVMRRATLVSIGGFQQAPYLRYVDLPTFLRMGLEGSWAFHDSVCGIWRRHEGSLTRNELPRIFNGAHRLCADFTRLFGSQVGVSEEELQVLEKQWGSFQYERCVLTGRMLASQGRFGEALAFFQRAGQYAVPLKSRGLLQVASLFLRLRLSPEGLYRAVGKPGWESQYKRDMDPIVSQEMKPEDFEVFPFR